MKFLFTLVSLLVSSVFAAETLTSHSGANVGANVGANPNVNVGNVGANPNVNVGNIRAGHHLRERVGDSSSLSSSTSRSTNPQTGVCTLDFHHAASLHGGNIHLSFIPTSGLPTFVDAHVAHCSPELLSSSTHSSRSSSSLYHSSKKMKKHECTLNFEQLPFDMPLAKNDHLTSPNNAGQTYTFTIPVSEVSSSSRGVGSHEGESGPLCYAFTYEHNGIQCNSNICPLN